MNKQKFDNKLNRPNLAFQPLYKQVEEHVKQLIIEQRWKPGEALPNEFQLADELGVSQGTVRKALNGLTDSKILTRKQGVGTFVSEHNNQQSLYRFFPLIKDGAAPELPKAVLLSLAIEEVTPEIRSKLGLKSTEKVIHLVRQRVLQEQFCIIESIYLPHKFFKGLETETDLPHTLYHYYQQEFNLTVQDTQDSIKAVLANIEDEKLLGIKPNSALLEVKRITRTIDGKTIEYRVSRCRSDEFHYLVDLG
ncbi:GntR family transcriptional regulator [Glaciecola sp. KUL10]|uniref:GntR family transcriptional regulator n=1 Tax=Glaciecola sp. (strain KUL10) TaxID=2161813 RepID=UPI000D785AEC|nr:GntR family transcriptional regulator [Glaciecola sp. KUL10]GBL03187.1 GntR family transcriptional regulator [Glaciecola sp. KUL10]